MSQRRRFASRCTATLAVWLGFGCGRLIGIDTITYTPEAGEGADTRDDVPESGAPPDRQTVAPSDAEAGADSAMASVDATDATDATDAHVCDPDATDSDKHNCGRCGHDCLGGDCRASRCMPVLVAGALARPWAIAASNDGYIYWVDGQDGTVRKAPKNTPSVLPTILGQSSPPGIDIAVDDTHVYFTTYAPPGTYTGGLSRILKDGSGQVEPITSQFAAARGLAIDDRYAFYAVGLEPTMIVRTTKGMSDAVPLYVSPPSDADVPASLVGVAIDDQYVYATDIGSNTVLRMRQDNENVYPPTIFSGTRPRPYSIRVDGDFVYWADSASLYRRSRLDPTDLGDSISPAMLVNVIAVDATDLYFTEVVQTGDDPPPTAVRRIRKDATYARDLAVDVTDALWLDVRGLAVDDEAVYFTADDSVFKVAK
jgi:hypothetical protein